MRSELAADARFYCALRWPGRQGSLRRALVWFRSPGLIVLALQRVSHSYWARRASGGWTARTIAVRIVLALVRRPIVLITKSDVSESVDIGRGTYLSDHGFLTLTPKSIGSGTLIHERVSVGARAGSGGLGQPTIGENVWIGPDCVIYGEVSLGDGATVLPGSVVSMNVPAGAVAGGNPAIIVRRGFDNSPLRRTLATDIDPKSLAAK
jgi:serine acetyltransferase